MPYFCFILNKEVYQRKMRHIFRRSIATHYFRLQHKEALLLRLSEKLTHAPCRYCWWHTIAK